MNWIDVQRGPGDSSTKAILIDGVYLIQVVEVLNGQSATALCHIEDTGCGVIGEWEILAETPDAMHFKKRTERMVLPDGTLYKVVEFLTHLTVAITFVPSGD